MATAKHRSCESVKINGALHSIFAEHLCKLAAKQWSRPGVPQDCDLALLGCDRECVTPQTTFCTCTLYTVTWYSHHNFGLQLFTNVVRTHALLLYTINRALTCH